MLTRASLATGFWLVLGCSASATSDPALRQNNDGGSSGTGTTGSSGSTSTGGTGGSPSSVGGTPGTGGSAVSQGGSVGSGGSGGKPASGGSAGTTTMTGTGGHCSTAGPNGEDFYDGFEDGEFAVCPEWLDADPTLGGMWSVKDDGGTKVLAQSAAVSDLIFAVSGDYKLTDQTVQAKVKFTSAPGIVAVFARVQDARNFYYLYLDGSNIVLRGKVNNSSITSVKVKSPAVEGTWYTLKLSVIGSTLTGYLDGTMLVTTTDTGVKSGGIAVGTDDSATAEFDDVTVTAP